MYSCFVLKYVFFLWIIDLFNEFKYLFFIQRKLFSFMILNLFIEIRKKTISYSSNRNILSLIITGDDFDLVNINLTIFFL